MARLYKYINVIPKPLLDDFVHNKVIPFVGAGFSKNADIPNGPSMPEWYELGRKVANELPDYKYENNALDTLSYYETLFPPHGPWSFAEGNFPWQNRKRLPQ